jgi:hypothetical protein
MFSAPCQHNTAHITLSYISKIKVNIILSSTLIFSLWDSRLKSLSCFQFPNACYIFCSSHPHRCNHFYNMWGKEVYENPHYISFHRPISKVSTLPSNSKLSSTSEMTKLWLVNIRGLEVSVAKYFINSANVQYNWI